MSEVIPYLLPVILLSVFAPTPSRAVEGTLSLEQYLGQALKDSPAVQASREIITGTEQTALEKNLIPRLFFQGGHTIDHREFSNEFLGGRLIQDNYTLGIEDQWTFGLNTKLSYNLLNNTTTNLPPIVFPPSGSNIYTSGQIELDITQPLWRNFFGVETRANQTVSESTSLASHYAERFKLKQLVATAETAYHALAITNALTKLQEDLVEHSRKILEWNTRRVRDHIADRVDELQSQANYQTRKLELMNSQVLIHTAKVNFNTLRDQPGEDVVEQVILPDSDTALALSIPEKADVTDDIKAAEQNERLTRANNELSLQKVQPDLNLIASAAFNGVDAYLSPAISQSFTTNSPYYYIGVKFSFPLYFNETSEIRAGHVKQQLAAEHTTVQTRLNTDQNWRDLASRFKEAKERLKLASEIVSRQKEKMDYERHRLDLGRTTTYQVLVFEQDYALAMITHLNIEQELLNLHSQLKVYAKD